MIGIIRGHRHEERVDVEMLVSTAVPGWFAGNKLVPRGVGIIGCLAVAAIHVVDQGGLPGAKGPEYIQFLYYALEGVAVVAAALLLTRYVTWGWLLSFGVATGPILGYLLSRGPGLPDYRDDIGNWAEPLGVISLVVEGALLVVAATVLAVSRRGAPAQR